MKYLVNPTKKHLTKIHILAADGKPLCTRSVLGAGWQIVESDRPLSLSDGLCWHCNDKREEQKYND